MSVLVESAGVALADLLGDPAVDVDKGVEHCQHPQGAEQVEQQVAHGGALGCHITAHRRQQGRDGGAYVGAEHQRAGQREVDPPLGTHDQRYGECG